MVSVLAVRAGELGACVGEDVCMYVAGVSPLFVESNED